MDWIEWDKQGRPRIDMARLEAWTLEQARLGSIASTSGHPFKAAS